MFKKLSVCKATTKLRKASLIASVAIAASVGAATAQADFPTKPIKIIVPYNPGGGTDTTPAQPRADGFGARRAARRHIR